MQVSPFQGSGFIRVLPQGLRRWAAHLAALRAY